jgi:type II secretory pathway pseudopilin PulG
MTGSAARTTRNQRRHWTSVLNDLRQRRRAAADGRGDGRDESGISLVEVMITVLLLAIVLAITTPTVTMFFDVNNDVQQTYSATNQVVLASEVLTQYLHEAITPCPTPAGTGCTATAAFAASPLPTYNSMTFYADVSNANGPAQIKFFVSGTTFWAQEYLPNANSCPFNGSTTAPDVCTYPTNPSHTIAMVPNLTNATNSTSNPILSYDISSTSTVCTTSSPTSSNVPSITAVCLSLQTSLKGGLASGYQTTAFALADSYNGTVG